MESGKGGKVNRVELQERINEGFLAEHTIAVFSQSLYQAVTDFLPYGLHFYNLKYTSLNTSTSGNMSTLHWFQ